jgi:hypothetical protein
MERAGGLFAARGSHHRHSEPYNAFGSRRGLELASRSTRPEAHDRVIAEGTEMSGAHYSDRSGISLPPSSVHERRRICRYSVVLPDALLGWWKDGHFVNTPVRLVDLSMGGCMIELPRLPSQSKGENIWLCPSALAKAEWTEGVIIALKKPLLRNCLVRIKFVAPFPYAAFKTLVYGKENLGPVAPTDTPEHERNDFWR